MGNRNDLTGRLDRYAITAKGQITGGRGLGEIAGYAAAVGAGLAMAGAADASIIYSGVQNISISIDPTAQATGSSFQAVTGAPIDMDGGGRDVIMLLSFYGALGGSSAAKYYGGGIVAAQGGAAFLGTGAVGAYNLAASNLVGPGGVFGADQAGRTQLQSVFSASSSAYGAGNFAVGTTGFVGIRLGSGNFGWIRLRLDDLGLNQPFDTVLGGLPLGSGQGYPDKVTVIDWAYDDSGAPIHVGDVPEPAPLALLAAGAAGIGAFRRRKARQAKQA